LLRVRHRRGDTERVGDEPRPSVVVEEAAGETHLGRLGDARRDGGGEFLDGAGDPVQCGPGYVDRAVVAGQADERSPQVVAPERTALPV